MAIPALLGIAYDKASCYKRGPAEAPPAIRAALASDSTNWWTESLINLGDPGVLEDVGDLVPGDATVREDIEAATRSLLENHRVPIILGGDHSITYPVVRALRERGPFTILHFDAHPDLYPEFQGDRFSHACPFARIMEEGLARELVQVGIRTMNGVQAAQAAAFGVQVVGMQEWERGWQFKTDFPVYLSVDIDVLDPAFSAWSGMSTVTASPSPQGGPWCGLSSIGAPADGWGENEAIEQTISGLVIGQQYTISYYAANFGGSPFDGPGKVLAFLNGTQIAASPTLALQANTWVPVTATFTATASSGILQIDVVEDAIGTP